MSIYFNNSRCRFNVVTGTIVHDGGPMSQKTCHLRRGGSEPKTSQIIAENKQKILNTLQELASKEDHPLFQEYQSVCIDTINNRKTLVDVTEYKTHGYEFESYKFGYNIVFDSLSATFYLVKGSGKDYGAFVYHFDEQDFPVKDCRKDDVDFFAQHKKTMSRVSKLINAFQNSIENDTDTDVSSIEKLYEQFRQQDKLQFSNSF